jgi:glycosyltransferase involved in cell wall biosynthesis
MKGVSVSVVMSIFNGEVYLREAMDSILGQTFQDFEFIVIDDGSTDGTGEVLLSYAQRDARVHVVRHENRGRAESLNIGIGLAEGKYIARMDADDISLSDRLQHQVSFLDDHPEVGLLGGAFDSISVDGHVLNKVQYPTEDMEIRAVMLRYNPFCHPTVMMRKELAVAAGLYRKALLDADDYDLWLRMSERCKVANLAACVLRYRVHSSQVSIRNSIHQTLCVLAARKAASLRSLGLPDPLVDIDEITPDFVSKLGVSAKEISHSLTEVFKYWMDLLQKNDPDAALGVIDGLLRLSDRRHIEKPLLADALLNQATIHYRQRRHFMALISVGHALMMRPIIVGRPVKRMFKHLLNPQNSTVLKRT